MVRFPNAKINIGLNITSKRQDGYHNLETIFYPVQWCDIVEIIPTTSNTSLSMTGLNISGDSASNLCLKAYFLIKEKYNLPQIKIHLHKIIPMGAGLGGGSADGTFVLQMINDLFNLGISENDLLELALELGSDCPFFILNRPAFATGRGEHLMPVTIALPGYAICILKPAIHVSTAEAFAGIVPLKPKIPLYDLVKKPITEWKDTIVNDFEKTVFSKFPEIAFLKELLYKEGAFYAAMSGSGSSVYGIFAVQKGLNLLPPGVEKWWGVIA